jgi:hypothetical protein
MEVERRRRLMISASEISSLRPIGAKDTRARISERLLVRGEFELFCFDWIGLLVRELA